MKRLSFLIVFLPLFLSAQDNCSKTIEKHIVLAKPGEKFVSLPKNTTSIHLVGDFNDSCALYLDNKLIFRHFVATDPLLGDSRYSITGSKKANGRTPILKMILINKMVCFEAKINFKYPVLEIRYFDGKWILTYTNKVAQLE